MKSLFHFFIDGLGLGEDSADNPVRNLFSGLTGGELLVRRETPLFFPGGVMIPADPVMGVPGIPQSATGQTSLFTGVNAQKLLGYHLTAFPNEKLVKLIGEKSLLKILKERGIDVTSANMYTREFFEIRGKRRKNMLPVSSLSIKAADIPFRYPEDYLREMALFADITNVMIRERGYEVPLITPAEGARRIVNILDEHQAVFFEYFMTDVLGHRRDGEGLLRKASDLESFVSNILEMTSERSDFIILITSDHGNAEDLSSGDHTLNPVPIILFSRNNELCRAAAESISDLTHTYNFILDFFLS